MEITVSNLCTNTNSQRRCRTLLINTNDYLRNRNSKTYTLTRFAQKQRMLNAAFIDHNAHINAY